MDADQLRGTLGGPGLTRLIDRLVSRLERGEPLTGTLTLQAATAEEREAVTGLLGRRPSRGESVSVDLDHLGAIIRDAAIAPDLKQAIETLRGPCVDRKSERQLLAQRWSGVWDAALARAASRPELVPWVESLRADGTLRRISAGEPDAGNALIQLALSVVERLPCERVLLPEFAARTCGDSHALDPGSRISALVLRALAVQRGTSTPDEPAERRALWESFGVVCDELSAPALVLNLVGDPGTRLGHILGLFADNGEPCRISTKQLLREPAAFRAGVTPSVVYVCENVSVLAAAATRLGAACPPMICIEGQPRTASCLLVERLRAHGVRMLYHGDFDWAGVSIANLMHRRYGVEIWRMQTRDYNDAAALGTALEGSAVDAIWDDGLRHAMQHAGKAVHEECVVDALIDDLIGTANR